MSAASLALVSVFALAAGVADPRLPEWVPVPAPHTWSRAWLCANYSDSWYLRSSESGHLELLSAPDRRVEDPIPFTIAPAEDRRGARHVLQANAGWLVGFDAGEFGGGLWWYRSAGAEGARIRPPTDAPVHPSDYYKADNVRGFGRVGGELVVLVGLDHLEGRSGRVFEVKATGEDVVLAPRAVLDGSPQAWVADGSSLLVLTDTSLYLLSGPTTTTVVHTFTGDLGGLYPTSMMRTDDGQIYIGLRRYLIRLTPLADRGYMEQWWVPRSCFHFRVTNDYKCECISHK